MNQLTDLVAYDVAANARLRREGTRHLVDAALGRCPPPDQLR
jgi:hypothetical protein